MNRSLMIKRRQNNSIYLSHGLPLVLLICCLVASCTESSPPTLRLGTNVWPGYEPLYLARHTGKLDTERVQLVELSSSTQVMQAFRNDLIDAAALTLDEVLQLSDTGEALQVVLIMDTSHGADAIVAQASIDSLGDLKGKKIGVEGNALGAYVISRALDSANLARAAIEIVPLDIDQQEKAFLQRKVAAVVTFEPLLGKLLMAGGHVIFDSSQIPNEIIDVLVVRTAYLERHPKVVQELINAWFDSISLIGTEPHQTAEILGRRMGLGVEDTLAAYAGLKIPGRAENQGLLKGQPQPELAQTIDKISEVMLKQALIKSSVEPSALLGDTTLYYEKN
ncbi:MAG: ABC transporter substrate-binding protein [Gammaproteobacteria bacterium]|nr:MAG: ABC transporter substrate-binding protein [Gammaproteobacteria bacterium]